MVIQHNASAANSSRQLGIISGLQASSTEKLSSGYKINRSADNAAGLSISEKMRKQIRGLD
ncbi:MAG: flagellar hook protein, partial [Lachnospiraceae bacterium]|nr:flagellar hook protein [Lachnospiraceae bacterium]